MDRSFLDIVNEGGLKKPPSNIVKDVEKLETVFRNVPITTRNLLDVLLNKLPDLAVINTAAVRRYFKIRINARIRYLNRQIDQYKQKQNKTKLLSKFKKIINYKIGFILGFI